MFNVLDKGLDYGVISTKQDTQFSAFDVFKKVIKNNALVLDLGCGSGELKELVDKLNKNIKWVGLDVPFSPESNLRTNSLDNLILFDGSRIPFNDEHFDLVFCRQVLEHVEDYMAMLQESHRVLKKGGFFVGSVSSLEPFHSYSLYNFTPLGLTRILNKCHFRVVELYPGIDALTLILRNMLHRYSLLRKFFDIFYRKESVLNMLLTIYGRLKGMTEQEINYLKLIYAGHICFLAIKE